MASPDLSTEIQIQPGQASQEAKSRQRTLVRIIVVAFLLRLAVLTLGRTYHFSPTDNHFGFGWETGRIARSVAEGKGFSSPMQGDTGPTAWIAPIYPYFLAGLF